jgi:hypothetical protein
VAASNTIRPFASPGSVNFTEHPTFVVEKCLEEHDSEDGEEGLGEGFEWQGGRHSGGGYWVNGWWVSGWWREGCLRPAQGSDEVVWC